MKKIFHQALLALFTFVKTPGPRQFLVAFGLLGILQLKQNNIGSMRERGKYSLVLTTSRGMHTMLTFLVTLSFQVRKS